MSEKTNPSNSMVNAVLNQYQNLNEKKAASTGATKTDLSNYFTPKGALPKGVNSKDVTIRILPPHEGESTPFTVVKFHSIKVGGSWRKLYDPAQEGKRSPMNEMRQVLLSSDDKDDRRNAINYKSNDYFICRVIQRDKEHEGIKYFRFRITDNGEGFMDKIVPYMQRQYDLFDPNNGCDVTLSLKRDRENVKITAVMVEAPGPVSSDPVQMEQWLADQTTWENVFKKYDDKYLEIIAKGDEPAWDKDKGGYVPRKDLEDKLNSEGSGSLIDEDYSAPAGNTSASIDDDDEVVQASGPSQTIDDEDLPF